MKKIIFSFDDGLLDFYNNVFPILKKYKIKATLNVITGFSDKTTSTDYKCCSVEQLKELLDYGIEIANHSNDHICPEPLAGYDIAQKKLRRWFPNHQTVGVATPYTQTIPNDFYEWCNSNGIRYVRFGDVDVCSKFQKKLIKFGLISHFRLYCLKNSHYDKKNKVKIVYSLPIMANQSVEYYKKIINLCWFNPKITFMFHSLYDNESSFSSCPYPEGAWTIGKFEELIKWILNKGYKVCRQCDTI